MLLILEAHPAGNEESGSDVVQAGAGGRPSHIATLKPGPPKYPN